LDCIGGRNCHFAVKKSTCRVTPKNNSSTPHALGIPAWFRSQCGAAPASAGVGAGGGTLVPCNCNTPPISLARRFPSGFEASPAMKGDIVRNHHPLSDWNRTPSLSRDLISLPAPQFDDRQAWTDTHARRWRQIHCQSVLCILLPHVAGA